MRATIGLQGTRQSATFPHVLLDAAHRVAVASETLRPKGPALPLGSARFVAAVRPRPTLRSPVPATLSVVKRSARKQPAYSPDKLTVSGFLALWARDPDLAGRVFLTEAKSIADALFRR